MAVLRTFICDIPNCGHVQQEEIHGQGPRDFGQFMGIVLNGVDAPMLCPAHRAMVANFVDGLEGEANPIDIGDILA